MTAMGHEGAYVPRRELLHTGKRHPPAGVHGQKFQELPHIALVGLDGPGRHPPLGAEMGEPVNDFGGHLGRGEGQLRRGRCGFAHDA
jgi:hypothetical protein